IVEAVAASTALPAQVAPITIGSARYMDGGVAGTNLDAAAGDGLIVAILPAFVPKTRVEGESLEADGARVLAVIPDQAARDAMGPDLGDRSRRQAAGEAGFRQAAAVAPRVRAFWRGEAAGGPVLIDGSAAVTDTIRKWFLARRRPF